MIGSLSCSYFAKRTVKMDQSFCELYFKIFHKENRSLLFIRSEIVYPSLMFVRQRQCNFKVLYSRPNEVTRNNS